MPVRHRSIRTLMESVLLNLMDNARKAVEPGGHILLEGAVVPDGYRVRVTDDGRGISPEDLSRITEPFYMVDKSRPEPREVPAWD